MNATCLEYSHWGLGHHVGFGAAVCREHPQPYSAWLLSAQVGWWLMCHGHWGVYVGRVRGGGLPSAIPGTLLALEADCLAP